MSVQDLIDATAKKDTQHLEFVRQDFAQRLAAVAAKVPEAQVGVVANQIIAACKDTTVYCLDLNTALQTLIARCRRRRPGRWWRVPRRNQDTKDSGQLRALGRRAAGGSRAGAAGAGRGAGREFPRRNQGDDGFRPTSVPRSGLAAVAARVPEAQAGAVAEKFLAAIKETTDSGQLQSLAPGLAAVAARVPEAQAGAVAEKLFAAMKETTDFGQ